MRNIARNQYVKGLRKAKGQFMREKVKKNKGGVWKLMKSRKSVDWNRIIKSKSLSNESELAEEFATYFQDKINNLKKPANAAEIVGKLKTIFQDSPRWDIISCSIQDVSRCIDDLRPSDSHGPDMISNKLIKSLKFEALEYLTFVFNKSIAEGVFPEIWKCCKVLPTYKKGDATDIRNFRPICLYSTLGKLLEAVIRKQLLVHFERILPSNMFGFRPGRSTQDAVSCVIDKIRKYRVEGKVVGILTLDATSAFDLIQHDVILQTLEAVGAGPKIIEWIRDFLTNCLNKVQIGDSESKGWTSDSGSGQGRRLSPDMFSLVSISQAILSIISEFFGYADDGLDIVHGLNAEECNSKLQQIANERVDWYKNIGLSLNLAKSETIGFGYTPGPISIDGQIISPKMEIKFLGVTIQSNLKWSTQISSLCNKIRSASGRIRAEARHLAISDKRLLYNGWIQSQVFFNALTVLPTANLTEMKDIQTACNAGLRAVWGLPKYGYVDISDIRRQLNIPSVEMIVERKLMEKAWKTFASFDFEASMHGPTTRSKTTHNLPHPNQIGQHGKTSTAILTKAWNRLPFEVKIEPKFKIAQQKIRLYVQKNNASP